MSGESAVGESVSFAELEILKGKHETLLREHETSISTIELLEKKLKEALLVEQKGEYWEKKYLELLKKLETVENSIKDLMYSEVAGEDSGAAALGEDRKVMTMKGTEARAVEETVTLRTKKIYPSIFDQELGIIVGDGEVEIRMLRDDSLYVKWIFSLTKGCKRGSFHPQNYVQTVLVIAVKQEMRSRNLFMLVFGSIRLCSLRDIIRK
ncbi:hypothetical protein DY000_02009410 [Brassica cretica]|uniref:Uncharacterized protein n=1 Tax=Brassica cretica TaxID=69181 RepID=A0ABQ7BWE5_BRACR|nr:hypothetical protein DY000_02009410 [Brassica cretica]